MAFCLCPSASPPPSIDVLLQANVKEHFDRAMTERLKPFLSHFYQCYPCSSVVVFALCDLLPTSLNQQDANCHLLIAYFKDHPAHTQRCSLY